MERIDNLIRQVREQTGNQVYSGTQGIQQREFVRHANAAQTRIYNRILQERSSLFTKVGYLDTTAGTAVYTLPTDVFLKHNLIKVDYSHNGAATNYSPLTLRTPRQEVSTSGYPDSYFLRHGQIVVSPIPSSSVTNGLRLNYQYVIPTLDIRRGKITTVTTAGSYLASVTLDTATGLVTDETIADLATGLDYVDYISCVSKDGVISSSTSGIPLAAGSTKYVSSTGVLSFLASTSLTASNPIVAGDYVVFGKYATTHSQLPDLCERYLADYMALRIQMRDSSAESGDTAPVLAAMEQEILDAIGNLEEDLPGIPILDSSMLNYDEDL
jgi:hypothetical protein